MATTQIVLRLGVLDGDDPEAWDPFGQSMKDERVRVQQTIAEVAATHKQSTILQPDLLLTKVEHLERESKLREVVGLLVDGKNLNRNTQAREIAARDKQIQSVCAAIKKQSDPLYKQTGFHIWIVVDAMPHPDDDQVVVPTMKNWSLTTASTLGVSPREISVQRLWVWDHLATMFRMALDGAAHQIN